MKNKNRNITIEILPDIPISNGGALYYWYRLSTSVGLVDIVPMIEDGQFFWRISYSTYYSNNFTVLNCAFYEAIKYLEGGGK